jgi:hypothetical protein
VRRFSPNRDLERSSALPEISKVRERLGRLSVSYSRRDFNITSLWSGVTAYLLTVILRDHVDYNAAKLPE